MGDIGFRNAGEVPSWTEYHLLGNSIFLTLEEDDPEHTLMVQLTLPELMLVSAGLLLLGRFLPEYMQLAAMLNRKLEQLSGVQEFFGESEGEEGTPSNGGSE